MVFTVEMLKRMTKAVKRDNLYEQVTEVSSFSRSIGGTEIDDLIRGFIQGHVRHLLAYMKEVNQSIVDAENALNSGEVEKAKTTLVNLKEKHFKGF